MKLLWKLIQHRLDKDRANLPHTPPATTIPEGHFLASIGKPVYTGDKYKSAIQPARTKIITTYKPPKVQPSDHKAGIKEVLFHQQDNGICNYCGNKYLYYELEIEHIIPKSMGGPDNIRNLQLACISCNIRKGTLTDIEFRLENIKLLPAERRTPADPPINPTLLKGQNDDTTK